MEILLLLRKLVKQLIRVAAVKLLLPLRAAYLILVRPARIVFSGGGHFRPVVDLLLSDGATTYFRSVLFILLESVRRIPRHFLRKHMIIID